jgi:hypothetical protein
MAHAETDCKGLKECRECVTAREMVEKANKLDILAVPNNFKRPEKERTVPLGGAEPQS